MTNVWNVRIPEAQRWLAKEAAARERKTIAKWLGEAIEEKAHSVRLVLKTEAVSENGPKNLENREAGEAEGADAEKQSAADFQHYSPIIVPDEPQPAKARKVVKPKKEPKVCEHGTRVGFNCWMCGGIAKIQS